MCIVYLLLSLNFLLPNRKKKPNVVSQNLESLYWPLVGLFRIKLPLVMSKIISITVFEFFN